MTLVSEAMNRAVVTVPPDASVGDAAALARRSHVEHLLVMDGEDLVGIVCTCDLSGGSPRDAVCDWMTVPVLTVRPDASLEDAASTMEDCDVGCLPVALGGLLLGTLSDEELRRAGLHRCRPGHACHHHRDIMPHA